MSEDRRRERGARVDSAGERSLLSGQDFDVASVASESGGSAAHGGPTKSSLGARSSLGDRPLAGPKSSLADEASPRERKSLSSGRKSLPPRLKSLAPERKSLKGKPLSGERSSPAAAPQARVQARVTARPQARVQARVRARAVPAAACDLVVPSLYATVPDEPTGKDGVDLRRWAERQWDLAPSDWVEGQLVRLALASLLEARLLHLSSARLDAFDLDKDPERVTLAQLSHLWRQHHGEAGQAFELAVADAVEAGVPEVVGPLREALLLLGAKDVSSIGMRVLGLEKVDQSRRDAFADAVLRDVNQAAVLRTGRRGRPMSGQTTMDRIGKSTWSTMNAPLGPDAGSQMGRADALLFTKQDLFLSSLKINQGVVFRHRMEGWQDVPLWITRSRGPETSVVRVEDARHPMVVVSLGDTRWTQAFDAASNCLWDVLNDTDRVRRSHRYPARRYTEISSRLYGMRNLPIAEVCRQLRATHPGVREMLGPDVAATAGPGPVPVPDVGTLHADWLEEAGRVPVLRGGQQHVFLRPPPTFEVAAETASLAAFRIWSSSRRS